MKEHVCQTLSEEELVALAEGDLPEGQARERATHVAGCERCRAFLYALERSAQVTRMIWQIGEAQWSEAYPLYRCPWGKRPLRAVAALVAGILLISSTAVVWRCGFKDPEPTAEEVEVVANREALAAQVLAVANLLASQPGGEQYAVERYRDVIVSFPETKQGVSAERHLKSLLERGLGQ